MKFRKKPIVVDAEQWFPDKPVDGVALLESLQKIPPMKAEDYMMIRQRYEIKEIGFIHTLEGGHLVTPGDWIITGVMKEKYPCKPDIFEMTYERVE